MTVLTDAMGCLGAALLSLVAALLFEELTMGGLVRLLMAAWSGTASRPGAGKQAKRNMQKGEGQ